MHTYITHLVFEILRHKRAIYIKIDAEKNTLVAE